MLLDLITAIVSKSILRLSLNHFVDEICCFDGPANGHLSLLNLDLFRQYMIPYFFPRFTDVRPSSKHAFVCHYTHCEVVNGKSVILSTHNFRGHISRRSRSILCVRFSPISCYTKVRDSQISFVIYHQIFWFYVPMYDLLIMTVFQASDETSNKKSYKGINE